uniref:Transporter n=1 Tax=Rhizophora mucronata TaxID=61149 RepID=A0A2P2KY14_RHIMU
MSCLGHLPDKCCFHIVHKFHYLRIIPWTFVGFKASSISRTSARTTQEVWQLT